MKMFLFLLLVCVLACDQQGVTDTKIYGPDTINPSVTGASILNADSFEMQNLKFSDFENLLRNEDDIPLRYIMRFVKGLDRSLFKNGTKLIGKSLILSGNYKLFYIKQGDAKQGLSILISYERDSNEQKDLKKFLAYCEVCTNDDYNSEVIFANNPGKFLFTVKYYKPLVGKQMPDLDELTILKSENWKIDLDGKIRVVK